MTYTRYAVYYVPDDQPPWSRFATQWLGWDMIAGCSVAHPPSPGDLDIAAATETPRKYGFHATLKPPMRLVEGANVDDLRATCASVAAAHAPVHLERLSLTRLGRFLALTPGQIHGLTSNGDISALNALAAACVTDLDRFRATPSADDLARRNRPNLSPAQRENLLNWGYPFVLDQFRFHMTLTGKLGKPLRAAAETFLQARLVPLLPSPHVISHIALVREATDGRFHLIERFALTGSPPPAPR